ncbi:hemerythrin domain-containing protein [Streptacidiphilus neutrinimicus]|uniref:hemerythrin domain-containing protein n=1 Tax=Streptacidiphilus neutrinimicus TaxID=105420 RepID=UPI0005A613B8|nr:hemerythrin domain-containing protein [Streptacidiphilus neutrinimicus]
MGHGGNVIVELTTDHREVESMFEQIQALPAGHPERRAIADRFTVELVRHSVAEEMYLYPAVRTYLPDGDALADRELEEHAHAEELLKVLEGVEVTDRRFDETLALLIAEVKAHLADEEAHLFPALADTCSPGKLDTLGDQVRKAKDRAPTRPHPAAPDTPPANKLLAPGLGLVDRARDFVSGRGK